MNLRLVNEKASTYLKNKVRIHSDHTNVHLVNKWVLGLPCTISWFFKGQSPHNGNHHSVVQRLQGTNDS